MRSQEVNAALLKLDYYNTKEDKDTRIFEYERSDGYTVGLFLPQGFHSDNENVILIGGPSSPVGLESAIAEDIMDRNHGPFKEGVVVFSSQQFQGQFPKLDPRFAVTLDGIQYIARGLEVIREMELLYRQSRRASAKNAVDLVLKAVE
jgi:hypothetical protein